MPILGISFIWFNDAHMQKYGQLFEFWLRDKGWLAIIENLAYERQCFPAFVQFAYWEWSYQYKDSALNLIMQHLSNCDNPLKPLWVTVLTQVYNLLCNLAASFSHNKHFL